MIWYLECYGKRNFSIYVVFQGYDLRLYQVCLTPYPKTWKLASSARSRYNLLSQQVDNNKKEH